MSEPRARSRCRTGRPLWAALLSALVPGAGQWYAGRRRRALLLAAPAGLGLAGTLWLAAQGTVYLVRTFVQPAWLWGLLAVDLAVLGVRLFAVGDAYALARFRRGERQPGGGWVAGLALGLLLAAVAAPHALVATYGWQAIDTLQAVFADEGGPTPAEREQALLDQGLGEGELGPATSSTVAVTPSTLPVEAAGWAKERWFPYADLHPERPQLAARPTTPYDAPFLPLHERLEKDRLTVLLAGGDAGPHRFSLRTDVMIVATMNLETGRAVLFSISRDMIRPPLPAAWDDAFVEMEYDLAVEEAERAGAEPPPREGFVGCGCFPDRINAIWHYTHTWVRTFPGARDPGMEALRQTLSLLLGLPIDYYVLVDMAGFVDLVDALGGLDVYVTETMDVAFSPAREGEDPVSVTVLEPGNYHFDGHQALAFVRNRTETNDATRMLRQRCTLRALAAEARPATLARRFPEIAAAVRESTTTDIPLSFLPDLVEYAAALDYDDIATVVFGYPYYAPELDFRNLPIVDVERIQWKVRAALAAVETAEGVEGLAEPCTVLPAR